MMPAIVPATNAVSLDEWCFLLTEQNLQRPDRKGWRRYQIMLVVRNDRLAEFRKDLGPARKFRAQQFRIPGGVQDETTGRIEIFHKVGELRDIADYLRSGLHPLPEIVPTDLLGGYQVMEEARQKRRRKGLST